MTILLLNPPATSEDALPNREGTASFGVLSTNGFLYPPHTLAVVLSSLRAAGLDAHLLDAVGEGWSLDETIARIQDLAPDILGVYVSWGTMSMDQAALKALRQAFPDLPIIALGTGGRYHPEAFLDAGASHMLVGDPDLAFAHLVASPLPPPSPIKVKDLMPEAHNFSGLLRYPEKLPRPAWDAVPWQRYGFLTLFGARGCDDNCGYCAYVRVQGRSHRTRPVDQVVDEMLWLERTFQPRRIMMRDIVFAAERMRAMDLAQRLIDAGFHTPWECESRPEHFDPQLLKKLAQAGCTTIKIGIESGDPDELTRIGRVEAPRYGRTYLAYAKEVVRAAKTYGINVSAYVMVGLPGQTMANIQATAAYVRELRPTFFRPRVYEAYPRVLLGPGLDADETQRLMRPLQEVAQDLATEYARQHSRLARVRRKILLAIPD